ncbi:lysozyme [Chitinibacteraceae bacterium HSL-7]
MNAKQKATLVAAAIAIALPMTMHEEGKRNRTYLDIAGVPTACYGQTGDKVKVGQTYSDATCDAWLSEDLGWRLPAVLACGVGADWTPTRLAAMGVFAYNIGIRGACGSAAMRYARANNWANACRAMQINDAGKPAWSYAGDRFVPGLYKRRGRERALCEWS